MEIISCFLIQFRKLNCFLCILFVEAVTKFYPVSRRNMDSIFFYRKCAKEFADKTIGISIVQRDDDSLDHGKGRG